MIRLLLKEGLMSKLDTTSGQAQELAQALKGKQEDTSMNDEVQCIFDALAALGWHISAFEETTVPAPCTSTGDALAGKGGQFIRADVPALKLTLTRS